MTDKLRTAAQMALEALERYVQEDDICEGMEGNEPWIATKRLGEKTINILREALAEQPAPVAVAGTEHELKDVRCECCGYMTYHREHMGCIRAAYAARAARKEDKL